MSNPSQLIGTAYLAGEAIRCESVRLVYDGAWAPYAAAEVVIPYTAARAAQLDPRNHPRLQLEVIRNWHGSLTLDNLSTAWAGLTLDNLSTAWAGLTLDNLTTAWTTDWGSGLRAADSTLAYLDVRGRSIDYGAATITVRLASDELLAQDARVGVLSLPTQTLPARVLTLLAAGSVPVTAYDFTAGAIFIAMPPLTTDWTQSVWQLINAACNDLGLRIWCDESRVWRMAVADTAPTTTVAIPRASGGQDDTNLDGDWADVIVWIGTGTNGSGDPLREVKVWPAVPGPGPHRYAVEERDYGVVGAGLPMPSDEELAARLAKLRSSDRRLVVEAPADPSVRPGHKVTTGTPSLPALAAVATRVEWSLPRDAMTVTTRSTVEV